LAAVAAQFVVGHADDGRVGVGRIAPGHGEPGLEQRGLGRLDLLRHVTGRFRASTKGFSTASCANAAAAPSASSSMANFFSTFFIDLSPVFFVEFKFRKQKGLEASPHPALV
jgi:hypothetical protein